jgi:phosphohistidine phosphatase
MKTLILFRHAKSRWDLGVHDRERDLETIGIERTHKTASHLKSILDFEIDAWQSSPALRAKRTAEIASTHLEKVPELIINENLYTFSFFDLLKAVKNFQNQHKSAIIFGHNEAFTEFVNRMGNQYTDNLPTSGAAIIHFETDNWSQIEKGKTQIILKPKLL